MVRDNDYYHAESIQEAQFVYFPQCVSQVSESERDLGGLVLRSVAES